MTNKPSAKVLVPAGALGIPYDHAALDAGLLEIPDLIAIDGGSTDSGPFYLGTGASKYSRSATKTDWAKLMAARAKAGVPLIIGSAGTSGADSAVDWMLELTIEIAKERNENLKIATLKSGQNKSVIIEALDKGLITPLNPELPLDKKTIKDTTNIVALAGVEQIQAALDTGADIVIAGRTTDTALMAALPISKGCHKGGAWHGAKIAECGALATTNPNSGVILMSFDDKGFTITPMAPDATATPETVSAHMLYENVNPYILYEPGGYLDVEDAKYWPVDEKSVRVEGSIWKTTTPYCVKLEGARFVGFQTVSIVLVRDQHYCQHIDDWKSALRASFEKKAKISGLSDVSLELRVIGQNATLGDLENRQSASVEFGVMAIFTSNDQLRSQEAAKLLNPDLLHLPLTKHEPMPTFAFPFSPPEMNKGALYEFCLNHTMAIDDPMDCFTLEIHEI
jgi:hypothetical protein